MKSFVFLRNINFRSSSSSSSYKSTPLCDCEEEFDMTTREAKFYFRSIDLTSWNLSSLSGSGDRVTNNDPVSLQHWALVVHFERGNKTFIFEAWEDKETSLLQAGRAVVTENSFFKNSTYLGCANTSPYQLLNEAKGVKGIGEAYSLGLFGFSNNCQTFVIRFIAKISRDLYLILPLKVPAAIFSNI